jgi:hypothetical protein
MTWNEMAIDMLKAAKAMLGSYPRSSVSRAYYGAHIALAQALRAEGYVPDHRNSTQPHNGQSKLIGIHLARLGPRGVKELRQLFSRLHIRRIDSDYVRQVTIDRATAMESVRDASTVFIMLNIPEEP